MNAYERIFTDVKTKLEAIADIQHVGWYKRQPELRQQGEQSQYNYPAAFIGFEVVEMQQKTGGGLSIELEIDVYYVDKPEGFDAFPSRLFSLFNEGFVALNRMSNNDGAVAYGSLTGRAHETNDEGSDEITFKQTFTTLLNDQSGDMQNNMQEKVLLTNVINHG